MRVDSDLVREERQRRGWSQEVLAEIAGLSPRTIQRIEALGLASQESVSALCVALEVERERLLVAAERRAVAKRQLLWLMSGAALVGAAIGAAVTWALT